jgi:threonine synthase
MRTALVSSAAVGLRCLACGREAPLEPQAYTCRSCAGDAATGDPAILDVQYDYDAAAAALGGARAAREDLFRWLPLLPVAEPAPVLPAGGTALVPAPRLAARLGLGALYLKDETRNPTRCLKDRATAIGVTMALASGARSLYCASAGNAAISLAAYCAHAGLACHVWVPSYASPVRLAWLRRYGADVHVSAGNYDQAFDEAEAAARGLGWYSRNCALNPFLVEGKKTVSFEIAEQIGGRAPDAVVAPVGDGCTLAAVGKGFREMRAVRLTSDLPRLLGVQAEGAQPLVRRFAGGPAAPAGETRAASIAVHRPRNALRLLAELRACDGTMRAVSDDEIAAAQRDLAADAGVVAEFTSAAALAGLYRLASEERLDGRVVILVVTGGRLDADS